MTGRLRVVLVLAAMMGAVGGCNALLDNGYADAPAADASAPDATAIDAAAHDGGSDLKADASADATTLPPSCDASVDYTTDPLNCGGCGHNCGGKKCIGAQCELTNYVGPITGPTHLALGSTSIFWSSSTTIGFVSYDGGTAQSHALPNDGGSNPIAVAPTAGQPDTLLAAPRNAANGSTEYDFCPTLASCNSMDTENLPGYVTSTVQGEVTMFVGYDGGITGHDIALGITTALPAAMGDAVERMEVTTTSIFWNSRGLVKSTDFTGATATTVVNGPAPATAFSVFKATVIAFGTTANEIRICTVGSTCPTSTLVTTTQAAPGAVVLDNGAAYWTDGDTIKKCTKPFPCAAPAIILAKAQPNVRELALDGTTLYWVSYGDDAGAGGWLRSVPK